MSTLETVRPAVLAQLQASLQFLASISPNLPEKAWIYLTEGHEESVLVDLRNAAAWHPGELCGNPGRLIKSFYLNDNNRQELGRKSNYLALQLLRRSDGCRNAC